jgi:glycosyltransferase involved in cell wall biosynthesis
MIQKYVECDIMTFVSTYEGFGMPILEAQSTGRVVITSNISSMPEVAGLGAHLVDPMDVTSIRNGIVKLINNSTYRNELIANGYENIKRYNPDLIASMYEDIYCVVYNLNNIRK